MASEYKKKEQTAQDAEEVQDNLETSKAAEALEAEALEEEATIDEEEEAVDEAEEEDAGEKKPGLVARLFAPIPPKAIDARLYGSPEPASEPEPPKDAGDKDTGDIVSMTAEEEEYLFGTKDKDAKGDDFIGAPSKKAMQDIAGVPSSDSIMGFTKKDHDELLSTEMRDEKGEDFLGTPSQKAMDEVVDIPKGDDEFLFATGMEGEGGKTKKTKTKYQVGKKGKKGKAKSREQEDRETDEFLFGTKGVL